MTERIYLQLFHSTTPGAVPPDGLLVGEIGINVNDNLEFVGYGGDVNYDINGNPLPDLPPPGKGWKTFGVGGDGPPGPPGPEGPGVPDGGSVGQVLFKTGPGDYITDWGDIPEASPVTAGLVYGRTDTFFEDENVSLGYGSLANLTTGERNVAIGFQSGLNVDPSYDSVLIGYQAGYNIDGNQNVIIGSSACGNNPGGGATGNVILGYKAAANATSSNYNVLIGYQSGINIRGGDNNTIVGSFGGSADLQSNVILADGQGNARFWSNEFGALQFNSSYGNDGQVLVSRGVGLSPSWENAPDAGVTQILPGTGMVVTPASGTGIVTVSFDGDPNAGVDSLTKGPGIIFRNASGTIINNITSTGSIEVDASQVITNASFSGPGSLVVGGLAGGVPTALPIGNIGQVLTVGAGGVILDWVDLPQVAPATPSSLGVVFGLTDGGPSENVALGLGAGSALTGSSVKNTFIGTGAGDQVNVGDANVIIGAYSGDGSMSNNIVLSDGDGNIKFQINQNGAVSLDGIDYGQPGYVLSSNGAGLPAEWIDPPNAPIQDITAGAGINVAQVGTTVTVSNTGVTSLVATAPLQVSDDVGAITISAPNVLSDLQAGTGITLTGSGNTRTINNAGMLSMVNGTNTVVSQVTPGVWKVDASGGAAPIISLADGAGINITDPTGPTPTIFNDGVISVAASANVVPSATKGSAITFSLQNVVLGTTAGAGIAIDNTNPANPVIRNTGVINLVNGTGTTAVNNGNGTWQINATGTAGVTKLFAGNNITLDPTSGVGEVTITATGGGGGGSIAEIAGGAGINVLSPTGPTTTIVNTGVLSVAGTTGNITATTNAGAVTLNIGSNVLTNVTAGTGITVSGTGNSRQIVNSGVTSLSAGTGINLSGGTGNITITATNAGGTVTEVKSANAFLGVTGGTGPVVTLTNLGVNAITAGTGILKTGTATSPTLALDTSIVPTFASYLSGNGIGITGTGNTRTIANTGVVSLVPGAGISASSGTNGAWTIANTGVTKIKQGPNITITGDGTGEVTISSSGGGGGSGTVTKVSTGYGLSGGDITTTGTISVDTSETLTMNSFGNSGSLVYRYNGVRGTFFEALDCPATDIGKGYYFLGVTGDLNGTPTWRVTYCTTLMDGDGTKAIPGGVFTNKGEFGIDLNWTTISNRYPDYTRYSQRGSILVGSGGGSSGPAAATSLPVGTQGQVLTVGAGATVGWSTPASAYTATAPITLTGANSNIIGFDVATTALTAYVPKSAYNATGTLLVGSGVGTYSSLPPGSNGQILTVGSTGALTWANAPAPANPISLTPLDDTILMTPNPITGTGTIGVNQTKFVGANIFTTPGDMLVAAGSPTLPSRLPASTTVGAVLTVSASTGNNRVAWSTEINGGTY